LFYLPLPYLSPYPSMLPLLPVPCHSYDLHCLSIF
jgi:hypothetical protein